MSKGFLLFLLPAGFVAAYIAASWQHVGFFEALGVAYFLIFAVKLLAMQYDVRKRRPATR